MSSRRTLTGTSVTSGYGDKQKCQRERERKLVYSYLCGADKDKLQKQEQQWPSNAGGQSHGVPVGRKGKSCKSFLWDLLG